MSIIQDLSSFPLHEMLQHHAQTGKTGVFEIEASDGPARIYLMTGVIAHAETTEFQAEMAVCQILTQKDLRYGWVEGKTPAYMSMSASAQEMLVRVIQLQQSGEMERMKEDPKFSIKTRSIEPVNTRYTMIFHIESQEIPPFDYAVNSRQIRIGRMQENELILNDTSVSRKHAVLLPNNDSILVRDLGSKNGITINGNTTAQGILHNGDVLTVGEVICKLTVRNRLDSGIIPSLRTQQAAAS